jgi:wyosine [tRNA(Phe)-imidazoG37] synthetase (radical SAM superfamily)
MPRDRTVKTKKNKSKKEKNFRYLYGPVSSWRLGSSLGVDLLSKDEKVCVFDCVYCQLDETTIKTKKRRMFVSTEKVIEEIKRLPPNLSISYITFSGRGEPTLAKNLGKVIKRIKTLRKEKIAVITDSSLMRDKSVREDLSRADFIMAKLDAFDEESFKKISKPAKGIRFKDVYEGIKSFRAEHNARLGIQIMFFEMNKRAFKKLAKIAFRINPDEIEINTPLRPSRVNPLSEDEVAGIKKYFKEFARRVNSPIEIVSVYDARYKEEVRAISVKDTLRRRGKIE